jgi:integrase
MPDKRVTVWVQHFKDRSTLMLQWIDPDTGRRKSKSAGTAEPKEAEKARADLEYELNHGRYQEASRLTWERFRELFEAEYAAATRPCTQANFRATLDAFEALCQPGRLRSISERTISQFAAGLRERGCYGKKGAQPSTIQVRLQFLHTALNWAVDQKMLPGCPKFPSIKVPRKRPQPVPAESFERLLDKAPDDNMRAYLLSGWLAGLRLAEAAALEWEETDKAPWLDLARDRIVLPAKFVKAVEDQWIPLDPVLREALEKLPRYGPKVFRFVGHDGASITTAGISQRVAAIAKRAKVRLGMHSLRKGFGCRYAGKVPAQVLQRLMRHSDIKTTMDYYANIDAAVEAAVLGEQRNSMCNRDASSPNQETTIPNATLDSSEAYMHLDKPGAGPY